MFVLILIFIFNVIIPASTQAAEPAAQASQGVKYQCPMHPQVVSDKPGECPICHMRLVRVGGDSQAAEKKILFYRHPMQPSITSPVPAKDEMGMDYTPVYEENMEASGALKINPQKQQLIGVRTAPLEKMKLAKVIRVSGVVAHDPEFFEAQVEYLKALRSDRTAEKETYDISKSYPRRFLPKVREEAKLKLMRLGMDEESVNALTLDSEPDKSWLHLSGSGRMWVVMNVSNLDVVGVKKGTQVHIHVPGIPDSETEGEVRMVSSFADMESHTVKVRALLENMNEFLRPETVVDVDLKINLGESLALPAQAVVFTGNETSVFVEKEPGVFERRVVRLGQKGEGYYQLADGIHEGEKIVVSGNFLVDSESRFQEAANG